MTAKKIRVLIVDDSAVFVNFLTKELPQANARIEIVGYAMSAAEAMRKIPDTKPDVITLDVEMPRMNGIDFLKELLPRHLIPVILVSSLNVSRRPYYMEDYLRRKGYITDFAGKHRKIHCRGLAGQRFSPPFFLGFPHRQ